MSKGNKSSNFFERAIAAFSPQLALEREAARMRLDIIAGETRSYEGGRPSRSTAGWHTGTGSSANGEIKMDILWLRERSRDLVRNNPFAKRAVQVIVNNTVGSGIRPSIPKSKNILPAVEAKIMNNWRDWAETTECDHNGQFNIYGLMAQAWRASVESGDAFIRVIKQSKLSAVPIKLQLLEADFLDQTRDGQMNGANIILQGIEFTPTGQRVAYWMFRHHPSEFMVNNNDLLSVRVPADEIMHIYEVLRPGQVRGVPHGVSTFLRLKDLDEYEDAQLKRQKLAAAFSVFVKKNETGFIEQYEKQLDGVELPPLSTKIAPGIIQELAPGEDITFANPPGADGYEPYVRANCRAIASGYSITYEALTGDLSGVNFSSYRAGWLEMHRQFSQWQDIILIPGICQPVWKYFINALRVSGQYSGVMFSADWTPPRREMIDPMKETKGMQMLVRAGLSSRSALIRSLGDDPESVMAEIISEQKEADGAEVWFDSDPKHDANRVNFGVDAYLAAKVKNNNEPKPGDKN